MLQIGAAVAASHLLKLDATALANAIGIATSRCGSLTSNTGTMTKSTHCGYAALGCITWGRPNSRVTSRHLGPLLLSRG